MNARGLRRYIDDLLRGRRPEPFRPDDFEAAQIRTAIDLQAADRAATGLERSSCPICIAGSPRRCTAPRQMYRRARRPPPGGR